MRIMGIDPGSQCTGFGIVEEQKGKLVSVHWGAVRAKAKQGFPERLKSIYQALVETIQEFTPEEIAIEDLFFASNAKSALKLGQTRGVAILAAANMDRPIAEYSPLEVKQSVVGYGRADKVQVQAMVTRLLNLKTPPQPFDACDALAIAICHTHSAATKRKLQI